MTVFYAYNEQYRWLVYNQPVHMTNTVGDNSVLWRAMTKHDDNYEVDSKSMVTDGVQIYQGKFLECTEHELINAIVA